MSTQTIIFLALLLLLPLLMMRMHGGGGHGAHGSHGGFGCGHGGHSHGGSSRDREPATDDKDRLAGEASGRHEERDAETHEREHDRVHA